MQNYAINQYGLNILIISFEQKLWEGGREGRTDGRRLALRRIADWRLSPIFSPGEVLIHVDIEQIDIEVPKQHSNRPRYITSQDSLRHYAFNKIFVRWAKCRDVMFSWTAAVWSVLAVHPQDAASAIVLNPFLFRCLSVNCGMLLLRIKRCWFVQDPCGVFFRKLIPQAMHLCFAFRAKWNPFLFGHRFLDDLDSQGQWATPHPVVALFYALNGCTISEVSRRGRYIAVSCPSKADQEQIWRVAENGMLSTKLTDLLVSEGTRQDLGITNVALQCTVHETELCTPRSGGKQFKDQFFVWSCKPLASLINSTGEQFKARPVQCLFFWLVVQSFNRDIIHEEKVI